MAVLLNVPLEVLLQITSYLTTPEYGALRRTTKQLEALLFGAFAREFFSKRQFALTEFSIQALVDIAKSRLGPSLTHLIIHLEHPSETLFNGGYTASWGTPARAVQGNRYYAECLNHIEFTSTGLAVEMLSDAVKHLPNLETIGMRDFHSRGRIRDGTVWNSYGCPTLEKQTGHRLQAQSGSSLSGGYTGLVFRTMLRAIGNGVVSASNPKLTRMEILLHTTQFPDHIFKIPDRFDMAISLALKKLTTIFLDGLTDWDKYLYVAGVDNENTVVPAPGFYLSRFLAKAPNLEHLRLNFQSYTDISTEQVLLWLADARPKPTTAADELTTSLELANAAETLPANFPPTPELRNLRYLDIGMATVKDSVLLTLYRKYKSTLRGVSLHKVVLTSTDVTTNLWARLCDRMAKSGIELEMLRLAFVKQTLYGNGARHNFVSFRPDRKPDMVWRGSAFSQAIKDISGMMEINGQEQNSDEESNESMDVDEEESNSDGDDDDDDDGS